MAEVWNKTQELIGVFFKEGSLGLTRNGESFESVTVNYFKKSLPIILYAFFLKIPLGIVKGMFDFRMNNSRLVPVGGG